MSNGMTFGREVHIDKNVNTKELRTRVLGIGGDFEYNFIFIVVSLLHESCRMA